MTGPESRDEICPDCNAGPDAVNTHITIARKDELTDAYYAISTWHTDDCPQYAIDQVLQEDSSRRAKEDEARLRAEFPAAFDRVRRAAAAAGEDPFAAALVALVAQQAGDMGGFVTLNRWLEVLDRYFPPEGEQPTA